MSDVKQAVDRYFAVWNETDAGRRRSLIAQTWADDATYLDPMMSGDGAEGIDAMVQGVQSQFPGYRFRLTGDVDAHHDRVRFPWELVDVGQSQFVAGVDFGVIADDGRLKSITGFLDYMPVAAGAATS
jgi:hypothetical protein